MRTHLEIMGKHRGFIAILTVCLCSLFLAACDGGGSPGSQTSLDTLPRVVHTNESLRIQLNNNEARNIICLTNSNGSDALCLDPDHINSATTGIFTRNVDWFSFRNVPVAMVPPRNPPDVDGFPASAVLIYPGGLDNRADSGQLSFLLNESPGDTGRPVLVADQFAASSSATRDHHVMRSGNYDADHDGTVDEAERLKIGSTSGAWHLDTGIIRIDTMDARADTLVGVRFGKQFHHGSPTISMPTTSDGLTHSLRASFARWIRKDGSIVGMSVRVTNEASEVESLRIRWQVMGILD